MVVGKGTLLPRFACQANEAWCEKSGLRYRDGLKESAKRSRLQRLLREVVDIMIDFSAEQGVLISSVLVL